MLQSVLQTLKGGNLITFGESKNSAADFEIQVLALGA